MPLSTTLTITTAKLRTVSSTQPSQPDSSGAKFWEGLSALGIFGMLLAGSGRKRTRRQMGTVFGIALLAMTFTLTGCDDHRVGTPAGSYTVVVTATGTGNTTPTRVTNLTLVVQERPRNQSSGAPSLSRFSSDRAGLS